MIMSTVYLSPLCLHFPRWLLLKFSESNCFKCSDCREPPRWHGTEVAFYLTSFMSQGEYYFCFTGLCQKNQNEQRKHFCSQDMCHFFVLHILCRRFIFNLCYFYYIVYEPCTQSTSVITRTQIRVGARSATFNICLKDRMSTQMSEMSNGGEVKIEMKN